MGRRGDGGCEAVLPELQTSEFLKNSEVPERLRMGIAHELKQ